MKRQRMRGQVIVITALVMTVLIAFAGLAIDYGHGAAVETQAQSATDAAALAGAEEIYAYAVADATSNPTEAETQATTAADLVAKANGYTLPTNYPQFWTAAGSGNQCAGVQTPVATEVGCVAAAVNTSVPTYFMNVVSINSIAIGTKGAAVVRAGLPCVICILSSNTSCAVSASGNGSMTVTWGGILDNSSANGTNSSSAALCSSGSGMITGTTVGVVGTAYPTDPSPPATIPITGIKPLANPLGSLSAPIVTFSSATCSASASPPCFSTAACSAASPCNVNEHGNVTLCPGVYSNLTVSGSGSVTLSSDPSICPSLGGATPDPPAFVVTGSVDTSGTGSFVGSGVMLYLTCQGYPTPCASGSGGSNCGSTVGSWTITGNGSWNVSPPTSGTYAGLGIFQDVNDTCSLSFTGNGGDKLIGTVYAADAGITVTGDSKIPDTALVVTSLTISGNGSITDNFNPNTNYSEPSTPPQLGL